MGYFKKFTCIQYWPGFPCKWTVYMWTMHGSGAYEPFRGPFDTEQEAQECCANMDRQQDDIEKRFFERCSANVPHETAVDGASAPDLNQL